MLSWMMLCFVVQQESGRQLGLITMIKYPTAFRNKETKATFYFLNLLYYPVSSCSLLADLVYNNSVELYVPLYSVPLGLLQNNIITLTALFGCFYL